MYSFQFKTNSKTSQLCIEIIEIMEKCCGLSGDESAQMINKFWSGIGDLNKEHLLFSETPYYWARCIVHHPSIGDNNPEWYLDQRYMPPPQWVIDKYYNY